jgi:hypothetical protein
VREPVGVSVGVAEGAARWLARRTTRRSFLGRLGRGAVLVAGGSSLAALLTSQSASARVCGQSGMSGKCPTYDCDDVWGWCWYATGCCAGGALKKICDCCRAGFPNVHGYCPSGTNVYCIVESCGADPRVQVVPVRRLPWNDAVAVSAGACRARYPAGGVPTVWLVDAAQPLLAAVAAPLAAAAGVPLLLTRGDALVGALVAELQRLGVTRATLVGAGLSSSLDGALARYGVVANRFEPGADAVALSQRAVADLLGGGGGASAGRARRAVCIEPSGLSLAAAPLAGAFAAAKGYPLVVGVDAAKSLSPRPVLTYLVGPEAASRAGEVAGGHPVHADGWQPLSAALCTLAFGVERVEGGRLGLVAQDAVDPSALLSLGGPIMVHLPGTLDGVRDALFLSRDRLHAVAVGGATGALSTESYYELQSIVNGFEAHKLIGVSGQGLPVIDQPVAERPLGLARRSAAPPVRLETSSYWTGRARSLDDPAASTSTSASTSASTSTAAADPDRQ